MKNGKKNCAHERNRTFTSLRMADFESAASTNSATWAANELFFQLTLWVCKHRCILQLCSPATLMVWAAILQKLQYVMKIIF
jgi:hypothetical protein